MAKHPPGVPQPPVFRTSVGTRLYVLLFCQTAIVTCLVIAALQSIGMADREKAKASLLMIGGVSTLLTLFLGFRVQRAIGPRIRFLVSRVNQFREAGVFERIGDMGRDDIGGLANALDTGFAAIVERQCEREKFLAVAAHELKTPVTSIYGYACLLASHPECLTPGTIETLRHQSWRLSRLIDALLLSARARIGDLHFSPAPFDASALVKRVLAEITPLVSERTFTSNVADNIRLLGDETLLEHALWSILTCAAVLSPAKTPVRVAFNVVGQHARLGVDVEPSGKCLPEMQELFLPFCSVQYENGASIRAAVGLYLSREIIRLHNGTLLVQQVSEHAPEIVMELPI